MYIYVWRKQFETEGCICKENNFGHTCMTDETVQCVRETFQHSLQHSTHKCSRELNLPLVYSQKVFASKLQLTQALNPNEKHK
jgi:hypothetical protein